MSKEWDASKVPPSRFQKREGSLYATPGSRDGHVGRNRDGLDKYTEKLKEKVRSILSYGVLLRFLQFFHWRKARKRGKEGKRAEDRGADGYILGLGVMFENHKQ
jgi:hypothetical protein